MSSMLCTPCSVLLVGLNLSCQLPTFPHRATREASTHTHQLSPPALPAPPSSLPSPARPILGKTPAWTEQEY